MIAARFRGHSSLYELKIKEKEKVARRCVGDPSRRHRQHRQHLPATRKKKRHRKKEKAFPTCDEESGAPCFMRRTIEKKKRHRKKRNYLRRGERCALLHAAHNRNHPLAKLVINRFVNQEALGPSTVLAHVLEDAPARQLCVCWL